MTSHSAQPAWKNGLTSKAFPEFVSFFKSAFDTTPSDSCEIGYILERIASDEWKAPVERLRAMLAANNAAGYTDAKRMLPAFAMSATLKTREGKVALGDKFLTHSGYLQADLDAKDNPQLADLDAVADMLRIDPHVAFFFKSPSGKGLKVGVKVPSALDLHAAAFATVERHFLDRYSLQIDKSTKDATRLSFVSYDPHVWINEDARPIEVAAQASKRASAPVFHAPLTTEEDDIREMLKCIPPRPEYKTWLEIASGVWAACDMTVGTQLLMEWSPEEAPGEYAKKHRARLTQIGIGTVVHYAKLHGFDAAAAARRKRWCGRIRFASDTLRAVESAPSAPGPKFSEAAPADGLPVEVDKLFVRNMLDENQFGDAKLYAAVMNGCRLFDHNAGRWMRYDRGVWHRDNTNQTLGEFIETTVAHYRALVEELERKIADQPAPDGAKDPRRSEIGRLLARISKIQSRGYAESALKFAAEKLPTLTDRFDQSPNLLVCETGTIDLDEGVHREWRAADNASLRIPVRYDPDATAHKWEAFLKVIFGDDKELIAFMRRAVGYSLSGHTNADTLFFLYGKGANGKSTFQLALMQLLAGYHCSIAVSALLASQADSNVDYQKARLKGRRIAFTDEMPEGKSLNEAQVKAMTGGDAILARSPYEKPYEFTPTHKLWMVGNHQPEIKGTDHGIWRRICLVPFTRTIPAEQRRPRSEILAELRAELPGILNWALDGWEDFRANGLNPPESVRKATADYRASQDSFTAFADERLIKDSGAEIPMKELMNAYLAWCEDNKETPKMKVTRLLSSYLKEAGHEVGRNADNSSVLRGYKLNRA